MIMNLPGKARSEIVQRAETLAMRDTVCKHILLHQPALQADSPHGILFCSSVLPTKRPEYNQEPIVPRTETDRAKSRALWVVNHSRVIAELTEGLEVKGLSSGDR